MTDPAIEAAQRAWRDRYGRTHVLESDQDNGVGTLVLHAAREALKPVKEFLDRELFNKTPNELAEQFDVDYAHAMR